MENMVISLLCFLIIVLLAIYWTLWKIRGELNESREKLKSELSEVRNLLEKKADKA
jgi:hypothetical protein